MDQKVNFDGIKLIPYEHINSVQTSAEMVIALHKQQEMLKRKERKRRHKRNRDRKK